MSKILVPWAASALLGLGVLAVLPAAVPAQERTPDPKPDAAAMPETEAERKEREGRRKCAALLCSTLHTKAPADGQVACHIQKTWRKEALTKILSRGKVSWPWGDTRCASELKFDRAMLVKAMQEPDFEAQFDTYDIRCQIDNAKDKYDVTAQLRPKVTFKQGKAVKANLNWGKIEAPTLAKSALWSITAADNTFGLLQSIAVDDINEFVATKCMEVKDEWQGK
ncbi:MAG: hypothetical protein K2X43_08305 [Hyphomonadaceae bacterium]|jgi:hypothetical protein|nr:hypothetical protein [Hyphomonadaceae bacterium]